MTATASPWAELIDPDNLPHLPAALDMPSKALQAVLDACLTVAVHHWADFVEHPHTAQVLAGSVPGLSLEAGAILLESLSVVLEDVDDPAALLAEKMPPEHLAEMGGSLRGAMFDVLEAAAVPELPAGAMDPRAIPAALSPRPATAWDALSHDDRPELGWPMVTVNGEAYPVPALEDLEEERDVSPVTGGWEKPGRPDTWAVLLELPPLDADAQARQAEARAQRAASARKAYDDLLGASA
ncbi:hypothetical protein KBZ08_09305 [Cyanobium sp. Candia 9D4]|uniref:hypothetical protein n=1 Tax=Cyanobium sp. Candia 9D4 TaxID=2823707 RepID=UPI0020CC1675|nr:hypothetical protein [Cyanobium sp. Candia 9D4]MCP9934111.1 hypothetical protein [Cyanobium sp. Candia 9D4]